MLHFAKITVLCQDGCQTAADFTNALEQKVFGEAWITVSTGLTCGVTCNLKLYSFQANALCQLYTIPQGCSNTPFWTCKMFSAVPQSSQAFKLSIASSDMLGHLGQKDAEKDTKDAREDAGQNLERLEALNLQSCG